MDGWMDEFIQSEFNIPGRSRAVGSVVLEPERTELLADLPIHDRVCDAVAELEEGVVERADGHSGRERDRASAEGVGEHREAAGVGEGQTGAQDHVVPAVGMGELVLLRPGEGGEEERVVERGVLVEGPLFKHVAHALVHVVVVGVGVLALVRVDQHVQEVDALGSDRVVALLGDRVDVERERAVPPDVHEPRVQVQDRREP